MAVDDRITAIQQKLEAVQRYNRLASSTTFSEGTLDELMDKAKALCDEVKDELDLIKTDIGEWG